MSQPNLVLAGLMPQRLAKAAIALALALALALAPGAGVGYAADVQAVTEPPPEALLNRGGDPFLQIASGHPACPEPLGPRIDQATWQRETHHRLERGYRCHAEGRCRLSSAYAYDADIAGSVRRRLAWLERQDPVWKPIRGSASLWLTVSRRWIIVAGCTASGHGVAPVLKALAEIEDVERVVDQTTAQPGRGVPYPVLPGPAQMAPCRAKSPEPSACQQR